MTILDVLHYTLLTVHVCRTAGGAIGICNGLDLSEWAPYKDRYLDVRYDASTLKVGKASAKAALQAQLGLKVRASSKSLMEDKIHFYSVQED